MRIKKIMARIGDNLVRWKDFLVPILIRFKSNKDIVKYSICQQSSK